jgi:hypothetical protein
MRHNTILLLIGIISLAFFIMPDIFSMFTGQHHFYDKANCHRCHTPEYDEVWSPSETRDSHIKAAGNTNYTVYLSIGGIDYQKNGTIYSIDDRIWTWNRTSGVWSNDTITMSVSLDANNNSIIDENEICNICHNATLAGTSGLHSVLIRTCDDDWCHGNQQHVYNDPDLFNISPDTVMAGKSLNETDNIHRAFYISQSNESTGYGAISPFNQTMGNIAGDYISRGYWTCIGCHSQVQVDVNIDQKRPFNHSESVRKRYL